MKKYIIISLLLCLMYFLISGILKSGKEQIYDEKGSEMEVSDEVPVEYYENSSGDQGEDIEIRTLDTVIHPLAERSTKAAMQEIALSYNGKIPYMDGAKCLVQGYPVLDTGFDYTLLPKGGFAGMDSLGYVEWLYLNTFGQCPAEIEKPEAVYEKYKIEENELKVGDIGMYVLDGRNHYGVCIGYENNYAVFSHCSSIPKEKYPGGCTSISYLASQTSDYLQGNPPEDFEYFIRIPAAWEE